ncbi:MAG: hypothetical protein ACOX4F_08500 [Atopobiaceae bacterium]|jgi:hypothetical protein
MAKACQAMLVHRSGTAKEDLYHIDSRTGEVRAKSVSGDENYQTKATSKTIKAIAENRGNLIGIHNHGTNIPPTGSDSSAARLNGYKFGIAALHDGRVFTFTCRNSKFNSRSFDEKINRLRQQGYSSDDAFVKAAEQAAERGLISWTLL